MNSRITFTKQDATKFTLHRLYAMRDLTEEEFMERGEHLLWTYVQTLKCLPDALKVDPEKRALLTIPDKD